MGVVIMNPDIWAGLIGIILSLIAWFYSGRFPVFEVQNAGPHFFPRLIALLIFVLGLVLIMQNLKTRERDSNKVSRENLTQLVGVFIVLVLYYFAIDLLGYFVSTFLFSAIVILIVKKTIDRKTLGFIFLNSTLICTGIFLVFRILLRTSLPSGIFF
jgi:putative tricarboxylic transport membrane protein